MRPEREVKTVVARNGTNEKQIVNVNVKKRGGTRQRSCSLRFLSGLQRLARYTSVNNVAVHITSVRKSLRFDDEAMSFEFCPPKENICCLLRHEICAISSAIARAGCLAVIGCTCAEVSKAASTADLMLQQTIVKGSSMALDIEVCSNVHSFGLARRVQRTCKR